MYFFIFLTSLAAWKGERIAKEKTSEYHLSDSSESAGAADMTFKMMLPNSSLKDFHSAHITLWEDAWSGDRVSVNVSLHLLSHPANTDASFLEYRP